MYILGLLAAMIIGILVVPFTLSVGAREKNMYFEAEISIKVFGYALFKKGWQGDWLKLLIVKQKRTKQSPKTQESTDRGNRMKDILFILLRAGRWRTFVWQAEIGLDDAAYTAVVVGGVWGVQAILLEMCLRRSTSCRVRVCCQPNFKELILKNEARCIVIFRIGNIIKEIVGGYIKGKWRKAV